MTKPLGKVIGMLGNLEVFSPFHLIFFEIRGGGVAGVTKKKLAVDPLSATDLLCVSSCPWTAM